MRGIDGQQAPRGHDATELNDRWTHRSFEKPIGGIDCPNDWYSSQDVVFAINLNRYCQATYRAAKIFKRRERDSNPWNGLTRSPV